MNQTATRTAANGGKTLNVAGVVDALCAASARLPESMRRNLDGEPLPARDVVVEVVELLRAVMFPGYYGNTELQAGNIEYHLGMTLDRAQRLLVEQVRRVLAFDAAHDGQPTDNLPPRATELVAAFMTRMPAVREKLISDVHAAFEGDPAARSPGETILCYPGILAVTSQRLAHELYVIGVPLLPRMITEHAHSVTGIDIHPGAKIGDGFFIDHGTGVVIGETAVIGNRVRIYQGVTLGAKSFPVDEHGNPIKGIPRHPIIEDDVVIYSGATVLGRVTIGRGSQIGGNVWLTRGVPPGSRITQVQARYSEFDGGAGI